MTVGFFSERIGSSSPDNITGSDLEIVYGLEGGDTLSISNSPFATGLVGGSGSDFYISSPSSTTIVIENGNSPNDTVLSSTIGFDKDSSFVLEVEQRHLIAFDQSSQEYAILTDWQESSNRVEVFDLADGEFSYDQIANSFRSRPNYLGNFSWQELDQANFLDFDSIGILPQNTNSALQEVNQRALDLENSEGDRFEDNDDASNAASLPISGTTAFFSELSIEANDDDWYSFNLPRTGESDSQISIEFLHSLGDLDLELYRESNPTTPIEESLSITNNESVSLSGLDAGNYLVRVYDFGDNIENEYSLSLTLPQDDDLNPTPTGTTLYRFFNTVAGGHFYTPSEEERDAVQANLSQYTYEGAAFQAAEPDEANAIPVYRFFNTVAGGHFYTPSEEERDAVLENLPQYTYEGIGFYAYEEPVADTIPIFRFFNTVAGGHFYTPSEEERDAVLDNLSQYNYENVGFYAEPI
ncbi:MAG: hypothetical protein RI580_11870 [Halothece sp. Uz-M2-17]|nr:hypothetical protein [Halothece sp. Uz-M2-17]